MKKLFKAMKKDRYDVTATSEGVTRTERVDTSNPIFSKARDEHDIKGYYEAFWGLDKREPKVRVLKVKKVR